MNSQGTRSLILLVLPTPVSRNEQSTASGGPHMYLARRCPGRGCRDRRGIEGPSVTESLREAAKAKSGVASPRLLAASMHSISEPRRSVLVQIREPRNCAAENV